MNAHEQRLQNNGADAFMILILMIMIAATRAHHDAPQTQFDRYVRSAARLSMGAFPKICRVVVGKARQRKEGRKR